MGETEDQDFADYILRKWKSDLQSQCQPHSYFRMWNDTPRQNRNYAWQNFMTGNQVLFMDPYVLYYPREGRNRSGIPTVNAICSGPDPRWDNFRQNLGYILRYSRESESCERHSARPPSSTGYCLAQTPAKGAGVPGLCPIGLLLAMASSRKLAVEWFNPSTGLTIAGEPIHSGSPSQSFTPPFSGDAVLYLTDTVGHAAGN